MTGRQTDRQIQKKQRKKVTEKESYRERKLQRKKVTEKDSYRERKLQRKKFTE